MKENALKNALRLLMLAALFPNVGCLTGFSPPSLDGDNVVFHGSADPDLGYEAIYVASAGCLDPIVNNWNTNIPGGTGSFDTFRNPATDRGEVAFRGMGTGGQQGIYFWSGGSPTVIADLNTAIPAGVGNFTSVGSKSMAAGSVAFVGTGSGIQRGIYLADGNVVRVVADATTPMPGKPFNFRSFGSFSVSEGNVVAFSGFNSNPGPRGIYLARGSLLTVVADMNTPIPGGTGNFEFPEASAASADGGNVAFLGWGAVEKGIYLSSGGSLSVVADTNTPVPGGNGNFTDFSNTASLEGGKVAFAASDGSSAATGIYLHDGLSLSVVADHNTLVPGRIRNRNFENFSPPDVSVDGDNVAFIGEFADGAGIYLSSGGSLSVVADTNTPIPGRNGNFGGFSTVSADAGSVAFSDSCPSSINTACPWQQSGIYLYDGHEIRVVIDYRHPFPGRQGGFYSFGAPSLDEGNIAFVANWNHWLDGSGSILYQYKGNTLHAIAYTGGTAIPGGSGNFTGFRDVTLEGGNITFRGLGSGGQTGVFLYDGNSIHVVADASAAIPGGMGNFTDFAYTSLDGGNVAFFGDGPTPPHAGVYLNDGNETRIIADVNTPIPGGTGNFRRFNYVKTDAGSVAFADFRTGIYLHDGSTLRMVADKSTSVPERGSTKFRYFSDISLNAGSIAFVGEYRGSVCSDDQTGGNCPMGIYLYDGSSISRVVENHTPIPGGDGAQFGRFRHPSLDRGSIAFLGYYLGWELSGVYLYDGLTTHVVADRSTSFNFQPCPPNP